MSLDTPAFPHPSPFKGRENICPPPPHNLLLGEERRKGLILPATLFCIQIVSLLASLCRQCLLCAAELVCVHVCVHVCACVCAQTPVSAGFA